MEMNIGAMFYRTGALFNEKKKIKLYDFLIIFLLISAFFNRDTTYSMHVSFTDMDVS